MFELPPEAESECLRIYFEEMRTPDLQPLTAGLLVEPGQQPLLPDRAQRELYGDLAFDLGRLLEEVRFEVAWAAAYLVAWRVARDAGEVEPLPENPFDVAMSVEILGALSPYAAAPPPPSLLFREPHRKIAGSRYLSRWAAAQLLDSALTRLLSSLDRVACLLHLRAGLEIPTRRDGSYLLPVFGQGLVNAVAPVFDIAPAWGDFEALVRHDLYEFIRRYRNGAMHQRRWPAELHGEHSLAYWDAGAGVAGVGPHRRYEGLAARDHFALLLASWNLLLVPLVDTVGSLLPAGTAAEG